MNFSALKTQLTGNVIFPGDTDYDAKRLVFPGGIDKKPAAIACVANVGDVVSVINFARENQLPLAVRSGGHSGLGYSSIDDGLVLDLRQLNAVEVDDTKQTAWVEAGSTAAHTTEILDTHDYVLGFGDTGSVGVGGITLGGGVGFLSRKFGLTIDNLLAAEIVTADGSVHLVDEAHEPDLFWAIRGGGGNFGVVTRFKFQLHHLTEAYGGMMVLPVTSEILAGCMEAAFKAPESLSAIFNVMPAPPMPFLPPEQHGKVIIMALMMYAGDAAEGEKAIAPFRALAKPLADMVKPMRYKEIFSPEDTSYHPLAAATTMFMKAVDQGVAQTILDQLNKSDAAMRVVQLRVIDGAVTRVPVAATAYAHRHSPIMANIATFYTGPDDFQKRTAWVEETAQALNQGDNGTYVNFLSKEGDQAISSAYPEKTLEQLRKIKRKFDPMNLFKQNQNILP